MLDVNRYNNDGCVWDASFSLTELATGGYRPTAVIWAIVPAAMLVVFVLRSPAERARDLTRPG